MIEQLEERARLQLAGQTVRRGRACVTENHNGTAVAVHAHQLGNGKIVLGYSFDGIRLDRSALLQLLCSETACPMCQRTQSNWRFFRGMPSPISKPARPKRPNYQFNHLIEEVTIEAHGRTCIARPAIFQCLTPCPVKAHAPAVVRKTGWDLFENGKYVAGGLTRNVETRTIEPMLTTIDAARAWFANKLQSQANAFQN